MINSAHYLCKGSYNIKKGDTILIHAVAGSPTDLLFLINLGGLGQFLCQIAKLLGARVIGTTSSPEKAEIAKKCGADDVILYTQMDFVEETKRLTNGKGFVRI
jgi:NADPH2:quinone reductase